MAKKQTALTRAHWALMTLKEKHGANCRCDECIRWMKTIAGLRRKAHA